MTFVEIAAWARTMKIQLAGWEANVLISLDRIRHASARKKVRRE